MHHSTSHYLRAAAGGVSVHRAALGVLYVSVTQSIWRSNCRIKWGGEGSTVLFWWGTAGSGASKPF